MVNSGLSTFLPAIMIFLLPSMLWAHGVRGKVAAGGMAVGAQYDTGEPMSYARVKISAPGAELLFQSGRTDRNGLFCFFPDATGDWQVVVDDEMGHQLEVIVSVDEAMELKSNQQNTKSIVSSLSRYEKALIGVSIILGIFGISFWWKGRKIHGKMKCAQ